MSDKSTSSSNNDQDPFGHPRVPFRGYYEREKCDARRGWVEKFTNTKLQHTGKWWDSGAPAGGSGAMDESTNTLKLKGNIEAPIGLCKIPVGVAGPLLIKGTHVQGYVLCPFATTEGALVASATRGATALNRAGGATAHASLQRMMRVPVFVCQTMVDALALEKFMRTNRTGIEAAIAEASRHARLMDFEFIQVGASLHVRFLYESGDAAGQNMTTATTWRACQWILDQVKTREPSIRIREFYIDGNGSGDKKVTLLNFIATRGIRAQAECYISPQVLESVFKVDADTYVRFISVMQGASVRTGMVGFTINAANVIGSVFTATGQDIACVHESSVAQFTVMKAPDGGIYTSMLLPSLIIGTVGGGTSLPTQRECLQMLGCFGKDRVFRFAEILACYCLALDLSTSTAICSGQFASSHEKLGRNRPEFGFKREYLTDDFFGQVIKREGKLAKWSELPVDASSSILSDLTKTELSKLVGHFGFAIEYTPTAGTAPKPATSRIVVKAKATDEETINMINKIAQACGGRLAAKYEYFKFETGFRKCHIRELALMAMSFEHPVIQRLAPKVYHVNRDDQKEIFVYAMEYLESVSHLNSVDAIEIWTPDDIRVALRDIAELHASFLDKADELKKAEWMDFPTRQRMIQMKELWIELLAHNQREFPDLWTKEIVLVAQRVIDNISFIWAELEQAPRTLCHNDFNPRNVCLKRTPAGGLQLCLYDWEMSTLHVPQHDVAEFLAFTLPTTTTVDERLAYVHYYRGQLEHFSKRTFDPVKFDKIFDFACFDFAINRLALYSMVHTFKDYRFLPRVLQSHFGYLQSVAMSNRFHKYVEEAANTPAEPIVGSKL
ncbi:hydroxymethylglutaryl-coenzyme A reductase [Capsaspora owczarzaki ATCC 30864]|uniref:hydroxymethylglutaryl-CoA reductase (NADPH) n=1 Tax=Capsaspora owczarzaki (strain ATCC 30864) TaxID=595528 RepID=A0A0D2WUW8_CAPO3|nr:hydroxymethylglutaryl-coenzyme A reductase [Capsaspora owczarzaki ATCC 30864]KJE95848.1 hydroxymethylglutaryl-coenzyme A reductase [Capsaspora owczarzaki ATCC 30864]|eukprot:XP_004345000.1 hydroxymethylglutaryl-coenzyme A reductase [Capsaspora owczarzaki ATCC 30864]